MTPAALEDVLPVSLTPALIVEDEPAMQQRLRRVLATAGGDAQQITVADDIAQARQLLGAGHFGVVLVDIGLPDGSGVELITWLQTHHPHVPAVVISAFRSAGMILAAVRAGAIGYLLKERDDTELAAALRSIEQGGAPIDPAIAKRILALLREPATAVTPTPAIDPSHAAPRAALTPRESRVLELVAQGLNNREIGEQLSISRLTVECHTKNIYRKLAVNSRTEAVYQARAHGLLR